MRIVLLLLICLISAGSRAESLTDLSKAEQYLEVNPRLLKFTTRAKQYYIIYFDKNFNEIMDNNENLRVKAKGCTKADLLEHIDSVANNITEESRDFALDEVTKTFNYTELDGLREFYLSPSALKFRILHDKGLLDGDGNVKEGKSTKLFTEEDKQNLLAYKESEIGKKEAEFLDNMLTTENIIKIVSRKGFFGEEKLECAEVK